MRRFFAMLLCVCLLLPGTVMAQDEQIEEMLSKAYACADRGDMLQAMTYVEMASSMDEEDVSPELARAYVYLKMNKYEKALEIIDGVIEKVPFSLDAWAMRYMINTAAGNVEEAQKDMDSLQGYQELLKVLEEYMASGQVGETEDGNAAQADADAYLDAIMASGSAKLTEKKFPGNSLLAQTGPNENLIVIDVSPDGKTALVNLFGELTIMNGDAQIPVRAAENRGAADEYGNLGKMLESAVKTTDYLSVVWSPDGRYASITNWYEVMQRGHNEWDPVIIDLQSGEIFLAASYPSAFNQAFGAVCAAGFSRDGHSLYYMVVGFAYDELYSLVRSDLETGEVELCYSGSEQVSDSRLWETADGALACSGEIEIPGSKLDPARKRSYAINVYRATDGVWSCKQYPFNLNEDKWLMDTRGVDYTAVSDKMLMWSLNKGMNRVFPSVIRIAQVGNDFAGMEYDWMIRDTQVPTLECMETGSYEATEEFILTYASIVKAQFSPGGRYVLAAVYGEVYEGFVLIDLEEKTLVPVEEPENISVMWIASGGSHDVPGVFWGDDGTILIDTPDDGVELFAIE